jgi:predicted nucleic acid-binding Zn ribbon protein
MVIRRTRTRSLKEVINEFLKVNRLDTRLKERELIRKWEEVTGKMVARSTQLIYIKDRTLYVEVRSSVIKNELIMIRDGLVQALNNSVGEELIEKIVIK